MFLSLCAMQAISQKNVEYSFSGKIQEQKIITPDSVFVENLSSNENKMVYKEGYEVTIIALLINANTAVEHISEQDFLWLNAQSKVSVSMNRAAKLRLVLYNISGIKITEYASDLNIGPHEFSVSAPTGTYVLVANDGTRSASLKVVLSGDGVAQIEKIETTLNCNNILKSWKDKIKFHNGDKLQFTGYYNGQNDVQTINANIEDGSSTINFSFVSVTATVSDVAATSAKLSAEIFNEKNKTITERGFYIGKSKTELIENGDKLVANSESFNFTANGLDDETTYFYCPYVTLDGNVISYGEILSFTTLFQPLVNIVDGAILAEFSVSETKKVYFSKGNLQYQASTKTWRFAENQYDIIGEDNCNRSSTYSGWIDLFSWGCSGYNGKYPYWREDYYNLYDAIGTDIVGTKYDWGVYNSISNGGNKPGLWRTFTKEELLYILICRKDHDYLRGYGIVNGIAGEIILPDNWILPKGLTFRSKNPSYNDPDNIYSDEEWSKMEGNGAIFFPCAGMIDWKDYGGKGMDIWYWTGTVDQDNWAYSYHGDFSVYSTLCAAGFSVRLVKDVK